MEADLNFVEAARWDTSTALGRDGRDAAMSLLNHVPFKTKPAFADRVRVQVWHSAAVAFVLAAFGTVWLGGTVQLALFIGCLWSALTLCVFAVEETWRYRRHHDR